MPTRFRVKRSTVSGITPTTGDIASGELAINLPDRKLFTSNGTTVYELGSNLTNLAVSGNVTIGSTGDIILTPGAGISANGSLGTANQVLTSNGSSVYWSTSGSSGSSSFVRQTFTANSTVNTTFTVTGGYTVNYLDVYKNGVKLINGTEVTVDSGNTVVLAAAAAVGDIIDVVGLLSGTVFTVNTAAQYTWTNTHLFNANVTVNSTFVVANSTANVAFFAANGNIGIGTSSPAYRLTTSFAAGTQSPSALWRGTAMSANYTRSDNSQFVGRQASVGVTDYATFIQAEDASLNPVFLALNPAGGNVGIGTSSPGSTLDVNGNIALTGTARRITSDMSSANTLVRFALQSSTTNGDTGVYVLPNGTATTSGFLLFANSNPSNTSAAIVATTSTEFLISSSRSGSGTFLPMTFSAGGSERMRITANGDVGIGTSSPNFSGYGTTNLTVRGGTTIQGVLELVGTRADGNAFAAGDVNFFADSNSAGNKRIAQIQALTDGSTVNNRGGALTLNTKADNGSLLERMRIDAAGRVTMPYQPAFTAVGSGSISVSISNYVLILNTAPTNRGSHFNTSTYRFTAPVAGMYLFAFRVTWGSTGSGVSVSLAVNGTSFGGASSYTEVFGYTTGTSYHTTSASITAVQLNANDYVDLRTNIYNSSAQTIDVSRVSLTGYLIG